MAFNPIKLMELKKSEKPFRPKPPEVRKIHERSRILADRGGNDHGEKAGRANNGFTVKKNRQTDVTRTMAKAFPRSIAFIVLTLDSQRWFVVTASDLEMLQAIKQM